VREEHSIQDRKRLCGVSLANFLCDLGPVILASRVDRRSFPCRLSWSCLVLLGWGTIRDQGSEDGLAAGVAERE
jgi:hypothetical protein